MARTNDLLATILIGNTLVNAAAASIATSLIVSVLPEAHKSRAVLYATVATTLLLLVFGEINPKTFAAHNSVRTATLLGLSGPGRHGPARAARQAVRPHDRADHALVQGREGRLFPHAQRGGDPHRPSRRGPRAVVAPPPDRLRRTRYRLPAGQGDHGPAPRDQGHRDRFAPRRCSGHGPLGRVFPLSRLQGPARQHRGHPPRQGYYRISN